MDPKSCWTLIVEAAEAMDLGGLDEDECRALIQNVLDLRDWFNGGGFVPDMRTEGGESK